MLGSGNYDPASTLAQMKKDLGLILGAAGDLPLTLLPLIWSQYGAAPEAGLGGRDFFVLCSRAAPNISALPAPESP